MTFSQLITRTFAHHKKYTSRFGFKPNRIIIHHWAGTSDYSRLTNPKIKASVNYILFGNGDIAGLVPEEKSPWTSGGWIIDRNSITFEVQNSAGRAKGKNNDHPTSWPVSDKAYKSIVDLAAEIILRRGWGKATSKNIRFHRQFRATACPGGYLWNRRGQIINDINKRILELKSAPTKPKETAEARIKRLAKETLAGKHGNGSDRKRSLGKDYSAVQKLVNQMLAK